MARHRPTPPVLRFDPTGAPDRLPALLDATRTRALTDDEAWLEADRPPVAGRPRHAETGPPRC